mmetsp:Transcript_12445/g.26334  ORF Transcript_12445/g.26334 Transcript_12445/m.26334 type:complete len:239 (-) Transcript_12445:3677-4393(-)
MNRILPSSSVLGSNRLGNSRVRWVPMPRCSLDLTHWQPSPAMKRKPVICTKMRNRIFFRNPSSSRSRLPPPRLLGPTSPRGGCSVLLTFVSRTSVTPDLLTRDSNGFRRSAIWAVSSSSTSRLVRFARLDRSKLPRPPRRRGGRLIMFSRILIYPSRLVRCTSSSVLRVAAKPPSFVPLPPSSPMSNARMRIPTLPRKPPCQAPSPTTAFPSTIPRASSYQTPSPSWIRLIVTHPASL